MVVKPTFFFLCHSLSLSLSMNSFIRGFTDWKKYGPGIDELPEAVAERTSLVEEMKKLVERMEERASLEEKSYVAGFKNQIFPTWQSNIPVVRLVSMVWLFERNAATMDELQEARETYAKFVEYQMGVELALPDGNVFGKRQEFDSSQRRAIMQFLNMRSGGDFTIEDELRMYGIKPMLPEDILLFADTVAMKLHNMQGTEEDRSDKDMRLIVDLTTVHTAFQTMFSTMNQQQNQINHQQEQINNQEDQIKQLKARIAELEKEEDEDVQIVEERATGGLRPIMVPNNYKKREDDDDDDDDDEEDYDEEEDLGDDDI